MTVETFTPRTGHTVKVEHAPPIEMLIAALRSEQYEQTHTRLRAWDGWTPAGILCELYRRTYPDVCGWEPVHSRNYAPYLFSRVGESRAYSTTIPPYVQYWAELTDDQCEELERLGMLNTSLKSAANLIEKHLTNEKYVLTSD